MPPKKKDEKKGKGKKKSGEEPPPPKVIKDHEKDGKKGKKGKKGPSNIGRQTPIPGAKGGKGAKGAKADKKKNSGESGKSGKKGDREGFATGPKPAPIECTVENISGYDDKSGVERILKLVTVYDDPDYGGCTISGMLSSDLVLLMVRRTHLLPAVLSHPCSLVARYEGRIIGICLCTDKGDGDWESEWAQLKATFPKIADRDEIFKQVYKGDDRQAGKTLQIHQLAVDSRYRRMTVATQLVTECVKKADKENYTRVSIVCTDAFSELIVKKLKFKPMGEEIHYKKFTHPTTGTLIYKCIYKKPHKKMKHYALRF